MTTATPLKIRYYYLYISAHFAGNFFVDSDANALLFTHPCAKGCVLSLAFTINTQFMRLGLPEYYFERSQSPSDDGNVLTGPLGCFHIIGR